MVSSIQIMKLNPNSNTSSSQQDLSFNLKKIIDSYMNDENKHEFDFFLTAIRQKQANSDFISKLLADLKHLVDRLEPTKFDDNLINIIFYEIKWSNYSKNESILSLLTEFLVDLNSAYTNYVQKCLGMLIKMFTLTNENDVDTERMFIFSQNMIKNLVKIAPTSKISIIKLCDSIYPYMIKDSVIQESYIRNLLKLANEFKDLRQMILEICVQKMLKIDVNSTREQILEAEINNDDQLIAETNETSSEESNKPMKHPLADRLDVKMACLFEFIKENCVDMKTGNIDWESCKSMYKDLLYTFDKYILFTYGSSHVQFIMFHICSFKSMLSEGFLDYLWKKFNATNSCAITKQVCSYYIGSYLARARYIPITTCLATLQLMIKWIHSYIEKNGNNSNTLNFDLHRTFYALCQTVFYVIIFRNRQLFNLSESKENSKMLELVKSWKLNEIITSKLNPLRYCLPTVRKKFARITYINQIAYCYSIIDANNRTSLPISGQSSLNIKMFFSNQTDSFDKNNNSKKNVSLLENPLDSFFPFDPYLLNKSKNYILKSYIEFKDIYDENMDESSEEYDEEDDDNYDEDDDDNNDESEKDEFESDNEKSDDTEMDDDESNDIKDPRIETRKKDLKFNSNLYDSDFENSMD